jgi:hypothetical protein
MQKSNVEILNHFYGLLLEVNFSRPDEDVFPNQEYMQDAFIMHHLQQIRIRSARYQATMNKSKYLLVLEEIKRLHEKGFDALKELLNPEEAMQLQPLFRRFEELTEKDEASIAEDQELLQLISKLKEKLDDKNDD